MASLATIKARYDPMNVFRLNQNIPPAAVSILGGEKLFAYPRAVAARLAASPSPRLSLP